LRCVATEQSRVAFGANAPEASVIHPAFLDVSGKLGFGLGELLAGLDSVLKADTLFDKFLLARLDSKVTLSKGYGLFAGGAILGDEVAGVACEHEVFNFSFSPTSKPDHFRDATKMVIWICTTRFAGFYRFFEDVYEISPPGVSKWLLNVSGKPELNILFRRSMGRRRIDF